MREQVADCQPLHRLAVFEFRLGERRQMYFSTGSSIESLPSSTRIISAVAVIGLVIDMMRNIVSARHRPVLFDIGQTHRGQMNDFALVADERHGAGNDVVLDKLSHSLGDLRETRLPRALMLPQAERPETTAIDNTRIESTNSPTMRQHDTALQ